MCHFILAVLPRTASPSAILAACDATRFAFTPLADGAVAPLAADEVAYRATRARCDCGTEIGADLVDPATGRSDREIHELRRAERLAKRKSWSPARLARWAEERETRAAHLREAARYHADHALTAEDWCAMIRSVIEQGASLRIGLVKHFGEPESVVAHRERVRLANLAPAFLRRFEDDVLYEFAR